MSEEQELDKWVQKYGPEWTSLYLFRSSVLDLLGRIESHLIAVEQRQFLTGEETISSKHHTVEMNRRLWDEWNWSYYGEEWTQGVKWLRGLDPNSWKADLVSKLMFNHIKSGSRILEIGPGAGRWTEYLQRIAGRLLLVDISENCLNICKKRFAGCSNIEYYLIHAISLAPIANESIDAIWSYDVFVHINPTDTEKYLIEFQRILRPGGYAIIHHPGHYPSQEHAHKNFRSYLDGGFFAHLVSKHGLEMVEQDDTLAHNPGDLISVFKKKDPA
jgi:ubiquinone/menaquinone biosynthesis C-methylase UbiE